MGGHEDFANLIRKSRARLRDFMATLNLEMGVISAGDYILEYTLHDITRPKTYAISQPFKIFE
jgi:hypothetical protein